MTYYIYTIQCIIHYAKYILNRYPPKTQINDLYRLMFPSETVKELNMYKKFYVCVQYAIFTYFRIYNELNVNRYYRL